MGWISVKKELPEQYQKVIGYFPRKACEKGSIECFTWWEGDVFECSHWMPLPEPPQTGD